MFLGIDTHTASVLALLGAEGAALLLGSGVPIALSPSVAARLTGRSVPALRAAVDAGELKAEGRTHRRISLNDLASWSGRQEYDADELADAFGRLSPTPSANGGEDGRRDEDAG